MYQNYVNLLQINKDCVNGDSTLVIITGSEDAQNKAKSLIDNLLSDAPPLIHTSVDSSDINESLESRESSYDNKKEIDWSKAAKEYVRTCNLYYFIILSY